MITELKLKESVINKEKGLKYILDLPIFEKEKGVSFKKGLNVIFAPNGSGKTTIIEMLAKATHCREWGYSRVSRKSLQNDDWLKNISIEERKERNMYWSSGMFSVEPFFEVKHDGQPVVFCDPRFIVGGFGADDTLNFGYEYMSVHKDEMMNVKGSTGKKNKHRMSLMNDVLNGDKTLDKIVIDNESRFDPSEFRSYTTEKVNYDFLTPSIEVSQKTLLIDEPESALDMKEKINWFASLEEKVEKQNLQVILITHSELALTFKNANFITLDNNYIFDMKASLRNIFKNI